MKTVHFLLFAVFWARGLYYMTQLESWNAFSATGAGFLRGRRDPKEKKKNSEDPASNKPVIKKTKEHTQEESEIDKQLCCLREKLQNSDNYRKVTPGLDPPTIRKENGKLCFTIYVRWSWYH